MRAQIDKKFARYERLFQSLQLTPEESARFVTLLIEMDEQRAKMEEVAAAKGLASSLDEIEALRKQLYTPIIDELQQMVGKEGFKQYLSYEKTSYYSTAFTEPLVREFAAASMPLDSANAALLTDIISKQDKPVRRSSTGVSAQSSIDWQAVADQAASILTPAQIEALRRKSQPGRG